jgi:photosystem II stability/assembly factor-like uncharacterized protein
VVIGVLVYVEGHDRSGGLPTARTDDPAHVHALGLNPADDSLLLATHDGLYEVPKGMSRARRISADYQDTKGLTVAGPDHLLGSGHPDSGALQAGLPPHLGLIESRDGGRSWEAVSLAGDADFHVLRVVRDLVYGYDAATERLLVSRDGGRSWAERASPGELIDLAANPVDARHLVATTSGGLVTSEDGGRTWDALGFERALLAWPDERMLYLLGADGEMYVSADGGWSLTPRGHVGGAPAALSADHDGALYVALQDRTVRVSGDGGTTWRVRSSPGA